LASRVKGKALGLLPGGGVVGWLHETMRAHALKAEMIAEKVFIGASCIKLVASVINILATLCCVK
jgi:hypothetical protein